MTVGTDLGEQTWVDAEVSAPSRVLLLPLGSTEQHGPHLPLGTDTIIAIELARAVAARRDDVTVAPPLAYGASGEHGDFPGTLSIGTEVLESVVVELVRSADAFAGVVLVSGHGGNAEALARAAATLASEGRDVLVWFPKVERGDAHAGHTETSQLLALRPELVRADLVVAGRREKLCDLMPALVREGVRAVSPNGILGDPTDASAAAGVAVIEALADDLDAVISEWRR